MNFYTDIKNENTITVTWEDYEWDCIFEGDADLEKACLIIESAIDDWYNVESHPELEDLCIGDVMNERLIDNGYTYDETEPTIDSDYYN